MTQRIEGVVVLSGAVGGRRGWELMLTLSPWRKAPGVAQRSVLRVLIPVESRRAASRLWTKWEKAAGAVVQLEVGPLKAGAKITTFDKWGYGKLPIRRLRSAPELQAALAEKEKSKRKGAKLEVPGIGVVKADGDGGYVSKAVVVPAFGGKRLRFLLEGYGGDPQRAEFSVAVANLLSADGAVLKKAEPHIFGYYRDCRDRWGAEDPDFPAITSTADVWEHVTFGDELTVRRRAYGDKGIYVSLGCHCGWEQEHGLQLVLKNGLAVTKLGPYDGHLTNSDAYADKKLERVVYRSFRARNAKAR